MSGRSYLDAEPWEGRFASAPRLRARPGEAKPRQAIEVARRYAMGLATIDQLREARYATYAAYAYAYSAAAAAAAAAAADDADADAADAADYAAYAARWRQVDRLLFVLRGGQ